MLSYLFQNQLSERYMQIERSVINLAENRHLLFTEFAGQLENTETI